MAPAETRPIGTPRASVATERFRPCLPRSTGERPALSPPQGALVMHPSTDSSWSWRPIMRSYACTASPWTCSAMPSCDQYLTRRRMVRSEHWRSAIRSYPEPCTRAAMTRSKTIRSGMRGLWQPSGWVSTCSGSSAANWSHRGSSRHDGRTGTSPPVITERQELHDHPGSCLSCLRVVTRPFATPTAGLSYRRV